MVEQRLALCQEERHRRIANRTAIGMGATNPKARAGQSKARLQRYEELPLRIPKAARDHEDIYSAGRALGSIRHRIKNLEKAMTMIAMDSLSFNLPPGGIPWHHWPQWRRKTTCSACVRIEKPTAARSVGSSSSSLTLDHHGSTQR